MEDSTKNNDYSEDIFQDQSEKCVRNTTETGRGNLPSPRSVKVPYLLSNQPPTPSSQAPNIKLDEIFSSSDVYSYRELPNHTNCSRNEDALTSPLHSPANSGVKNNRRDRSSFGENRNADLVAPSERRTVPVIISLSKILQESNTLSSEKQSVKINMELTPTKRMKQTLESGSGKSEEDRSSFGENRNPDFVPPLERRTIPVIILSLPKILQETNTPSSETQSVEMDMEPTPNKRMKQTLESNSGKAEAAMKSFYEYPINLQAQESKAGVRRKKESESLTIPSEIMMKKMKTSSSDAKTANDAFKSNFNFPTSSANIDHLPPTNLQTQKTKVIVRNVEESESTTEEKTIRDCSTDSNSLVKHSYPDNLQKIGSCLNFLADTDESAIHLNALIDASTNPNLESGKQKDRSDVLAEAVFPNLPLRALETTNELSGSNIATAPNSRTSSTEDIGSFTEIKKTRYSSSVSFKETQSALNLADSAPKIQILKSSQYKPVILNPHLPLSSKVLDSGIETPGFKSAPSSPIFLNPHLPLSCHLPEQSSSSDINASRRVLEFETYDEKVGTAENRPDSSTQTIVSNRKSSSSFQGVQNNRTELTPLNLTRAEFMRDSSISSHFKNQHKHSDIYGDINNPLNRDGSAKSTVSSDQISSSKSRPEIPSDCSQTSPELRRSLPRSASKTTSKSRTPLEYRTQCGLFDQLLMKMAESNKPSTPTEVETQQKQKGRLPLRKHAGSFMGESSISRSRPALEGGMTPPHIAVLEGEASTSGHPPLVKEDSFADDQPSPSSDVPQSAEHCERMNRTTEQCIPIHADNFQIYVSEAHMLLYTVLEEIMRYNDEMDQYAKLVNLYDRFCISSSEMDRTNLCEELMSYSFQKGYGLLENIFHQPLKEGQPGTFTMKAYGTLNSVVVTTLISTLTLRSNQDFDQLFNNYESFRSFYDSSSQKFANDSIEDIEDEPSRNHLIILKKMIQRLMLLTLMAFRLLLMYVGENAEPRKIDIYEEKLSEEDKKYLRSN